MSFPTYNASTSQLVAQTQAVAQEVAAKQAADVDAKARFPSETFAALKAAKLLSAAVPRELGGWGAGMAELGAQCATLAAACGSSGMVLAMHHIQVACLARHHRNQPALVEFLRELCTAQWLLGSATSEVGTFGDTRRSICAVDVQGERYKLVKDATTVSYGAHCDAILTTCRRDANAAGSDQVLALARKHEIQLDLTTTWDTLGMRGTCSPGYKMTIEAPAAFVLPDGFPLEAAVTMVPYSHILWSALWCGIAGDAVAKAASYVRSEARKQPGTVPPTAVRLAEAQGLLQQMRHNWLALAHEFDEIATQPNQFDTLQSVGWALKMNNCKTGSSELAPQIVHRALQILGIPGFKNDSKLSVGRHYRDVLSASLMISNDRIRDKSAAMLLVFKDE